MADISIRGLDDKVKRGLRLRAAHNGRSMEAEARDIITHVVVGANAPGFFQSTVNRFDAIGGVTLGIPERRATTPRVNLSQ